MADSTEKGPQSVEVPFTVTVNTSGTVPAPLAGLQCAWLSGAGFTRISKFTFSSLVSGMDSMFEPKLSNNHILWDFGDGYSLSAADTLTTEHTYQVPGIYKVSQYLFDANGDAIVNTLTASVSVYNYIQTDIKVNTAFTKEMTGSSASLYQGSWQIPAGSKNTTFNVGVSTSWQDIPEDGKYTLYLTSSGSKAKPYDTKNKYAHLIPFNAFYEPVSGSSPERIDNTEGLSFELNNIYYGINPSTNKITDRPILEEEVQKFKDEGIEPFLLGATVDSLPSFESIRTTSAGVTSLSGSRRPSRKDVQFIYYDDIPNIDPGVKLLFKLDTSKHKVKNFYVDGLDGDLNTTNRNFLETGAVGKYTHYSPNTGVEREPQTVTGYSVVITNPAIKQLSFTSTGMKEMSGINYKRQGDKFQLFISLADKDMNILKLYPNFLWSSTLASDYSFHATWEQDGDLHTSNISSISTNKFPYNASTGKTQLSSFLYANIDPLSAGTWTLNVTGRVPSLSTQSSLSGYSGNVGYGNTGNTGNVGIGVENANYIQGSYTFTICPSTNDTELYKINEDIDYSQTLKSYRFQSFMHEYDNLFDGIFTSFVGEASSSPTVFGKTIFEKIANFVANNSDVDYCNLDNLQAFYDFFNEDIDIVLPTPPPELKRLYDLFSIKITKLLGDYERDNLRLSSNYYTNSADGRNVDFDNKISTSTYTVTAYTNFVARQKFNNEFTLIKPQKVASTQVSTINPVFLIRGNVGSGSSFSDSSTSTTTHTITANRNATHSTTQSKFTGGSIKIDGDSGGTNADYLCAGPHDDFVFGTDDFTIDCWFYAESFDDYEAVFSHGCRTNNNMLHALELTADEAVRWLIRATGTDGTETIDMRTPNGTVSTDTWHHIAAVRSGAYFYIFIDGVLQAKSDEDAQPWPINTGVNQGGFTTRSSTGNYWYDPANGPADLVEPKSSGGTSYPVYIGARVRNPSSNIDSMHGYIDEFRITRAALWTSDFTPPTSRGGATADSTYPLSSYNVYSNWGWPLDTSITGSSGLDGLYEFYPFTTYDSTSANENIKNSIIDFDNEYTSITRSNSSLSANWDNTGGIVYKNLDYQIRKGLNI
tara:strand:+ start:960 stop:4256 length:3297 start_codon:yes stop_codon:yes gene_type:complete